jgi:hypothetical protein
MRLHQTWQTFGLTVLAALTFWSIVLLLLEAFVGGSPNFPGQDFVEFVLNVALLLMFGWMVTGFRYAVGLFKATESTAFTTCIISMAVFAYLVAVSTYNKTVRPMTRLEKTVDRTMFCKTYPNARGCW